MEDSDEDDVPEEVVESAASGTIDGLRLRHDASAEVPNGHEALMDAAKAGHATCVKALLDAGVVVDATVWPPFRGTFDHTSIIRAVAQISSASSQR